MTGAQIVAELKTADQSVQKSGHQLAIEGGERAVAHANRAEWAWSDRAFRALQWYAKDRSEITIEQMRQVVYDKGLPKPPAPGAWGPVTKRAVKAGLIEFLRYETSRNPSQHAKPIKVWRVLG